MTSSLRDSFDRRRSASKLDALAPCGVSCAPEPEYGQPFFELQSMQASTQLVQVDVHLSSRGNVVNRELFAARLLSTVLAGHLVTLENVSAAECNRLRRHCIELGQCNDLWDTNALMH